MMAREDRRATAPRATPSSSSRSAASANDDIRASVPAAPSSTTTDILVADANTGWTMADAARVVNAVADLDVYIEQPCMTYEEASRSAGAPPALRARREHRHRSAIW